MLCLFLTGNAHWIDDPVRELLYRTEKQRPYGGYEGNHLYGQLADRYSPLYCAAPHRKNKDNLRNPSGSGSGLCNPSQQRSKAPWVERPRPEDITHLIEEGGFSFASGHAAASMFLFSMLIYLIRKNFRNRKAADILTALLAVPMIAIGISRVYLGVHYPTDVIAGWGLGIAVAARRQAFSMRLDKKKTGA